jgi:hypothetical protein
MILLEVRETDPRQRSTLRQLIKLDVQPPHNLCSCPETDQLDRLPLKLEKLSETRENALNLFKAKQLI